MVSEYNAFVDALATPCRAQKQKPIDRYGTNLAPLVIHLRKIFTFKKSSRSR